MGLPTLSWGAAGRAGDKGLGWLLGRDRAPSLDLPPRQPLRAGSGTSWKKPTLECEVEYR